MKLRNNILSSKSEEKLCEIIEIRWSKKFKIIPQLPFSALVDVNNNELNEKEKNFFYKTNIDFTLCTKKYIPLLSIEFDGLGGGYSRNGKYIPLRITSDPMRERKLDFKLKIANKIDYPLIVISYEEIEYIDKEDALTILDGIIGQILTRINIFQTLNNFSKNNGFYRDYIQENFQDFILSVETDSEMKFDPIVYKGAEYLRKCLNIEKFSWGFEPINEPPLPEINDIYDIKGIERRIKAMERAKKHGCLITIKLEKFLVTKKVLIRNLENPWFNSYSIARNIAEYLAFKKAYSLIKK